MRIYFDSASEYAARSRATCLGYQIRLLQAELGDTRHGAEWASVVFTQNVDYVPPRGKGERPRWVVSTDRLGKLTEASTRTLISVIPHEQVHDYQRRAEAVLPRWFAEGHATWASAKVVRRLNPSIADEDLRKAAHDLAASTTDVSLASWGSVRPKREAIMRQVSAEDQARMKADPAYTPRGTFTFTAADFLDDESNMGARYAGAWNVFRALEARHGHLAVRAWVADVTAAAGRPSASVLSASLQKHFAESLDELLAKSWQH